MVVYIQYRVVAFVFVFVCARTYTNNHTIVANIHTLLNMSVQRLDGLMMKELAWNEHFMMKGRNNNHDDDDEEEEDSIIQ
jgi:hypothetical protein